MLDYIRKSRHMLGQRGGMRCDIDGKQGRVTGEKGGYLMVRFDDLRFPGPARRRWAMTFYDGNGAIVAQ